jgi:hypothetical protein
MLVLHLFGRGVLGVDAVFAPRLVVWPPSRDVWRSGLLVTPRAIPTSDIRTMIGRSRSAVDTALTHFKGRGDRGARFRNLCNVLSLPTGVAIDGWLSPYATAPFMYTASEYRDACAYVRSRESECGEFVVRQSGWCEHALAGAASSAGIPSSG